MDLVKSASPNAVARSPNPPDVLAAWPRSAQWTTVCLLGVAVALLAFHGFGYSRWGSRPTELEHGAGLFYRIDLNRAERAELLQLPGVGENLAQRIEDYRREHGTFRNVDDLVEVRGIGPATLKRLRPWVRVGSEEENPDPGSRATDTKSSKRKKASQKEARLSSPIDINRAPPGELQRLPGIGPALSQRIVDERQKRPFQTVEELTRVPGIKEKTLQRLRPYITVESDAERVATTNKQ